MLCSCWCMCVVDQIPVPKKISEIVLMSARSVSLLQDNGNQRMSQLPFQGAANPASCKELAKAAWKRVQPVMLFENNNCTLRSFNFYKKKTKTPNQKQTSPPQKEARMLLKTFCTWCEHGELQPLVWEGSVCSVSGRRGIPSVLAALMLQHFFSPPC